MHDYVTVSPAQDFVHLNSCVIRNLETLMTVDAPPKRPAHFGETYSGGIGGVLASLTTIDGERVFWQLLPNNTSIVQCVLF